MSGEPDNLNIQLQQFGLSQEEVELYIYSLKAGNMTALKASRDLKIARTKIYRLLEKLIEKGLIIEEVKDYGAKFVPESPEKFLNILNQKERELLLLKSSTSNLVSQLNALKPAFNTDTKILNYRGSEGLKQVTWNSLKAQGIFRIYEVDLMTSFLDHEFAEKVRREMVARKIMIHQMTNRTMFPDFTQVSEVMNLWQLRHIPKKDLEIKVEVAIYNDVYCMYEYTKEDVFIVEIYNKELAEMQKQIFDLIWKGAKPMKILNEFGSAALE